MEAVIHPGGGQADEDDLKKSSQLAWKAFLIGSMAGKVQTGRSGKGMKPN